MNFQIKWMWFLCVLLSSISITVFGQVAPELKPKKVLLISDIDDTIKVTHVLALNKAKTLERTIELKAFTGMSDLYRVIISENPTATEVVYLSNAPKEILNFPIPLDLPNLLPDQIQKIPAMQFAHELFLRKNNFPQGQVLLRLDYEDRQHKLNSIRRLVSSARPDFVILIGDNGERDIEIYAQAADELEAQGIDSVTYIHQLYNTESLIHFMTPDFLNSILPQNDIGKKIKQGQIGYITPLEIAQDLKNRNFLSESRRSIYFNQWLPYILWEISFRESEIEEYFEDQNKNQSITFPQFMRCSEYKNKISGGIDYLNLALHIESRCQR